MRMLARWHDEHQCVRLACTREGRVACDLCSPDPCPSCRTIQSAHKPEIVYMLRQQPGLRSQQ
jgi:hypothetical protein